MQKWNISILRMVLALRREAGRGPGGADKGEAVGKRGPRLFWLCFGDDARLSLSIWKTSHKTLSALWKYSSVRNRPWQREVPPTWHSVNPWLIVAISIPLFDICDCLDSHLGFGLVSGGSQNLWNKSRISSIGRCQYILGRKCAVGKPDFSQLSPIKWPLWFGRSFRWLQASKFRCNIVLGWGQWRWEDAAARLIHAT